MKVLYRKLSTDYPQDLDGVISQNEFSSFVQACNEEADEFAKKQWQLGRVSTCCKCIGCLFMPLFLLGLCCCMGGSKCCYNGMDPMDRDWWSTNLWYEWLTQYFNSPELEYLRSKGITFKVVQGENIGHIGGYNVGTSAHVLISWHMASSLEIQPMRMSSPMFCPSCRASLMPPFKFCSTCGQALNR